ncbi:Uncharacterized protein TCM_028478 [Theobroma cacao]|uniref:RNase H type-1 domain-containing protein n=1 Tax=Theobroma cacao TaxID=3641 RepID=A0A061G9R3_THECC|nr:Uncharacterized protein TCM_028478 [Theobroma cacao]
MKVELVKSGLLRTNLVRCVLRRPWGVQWSAQVTILKFFLEWNNLIQNGDVSIWRSTFFAVIWTIWLMRNEIVFQGKIQDGSSMAKSGLVFKKDNQCPEWKPLSNGFLKFNVDGAARKDTSRAGIGGVLRDKEQVIRIRFSIAVMVENANMVEVIVIKEVFRIFASSSWNPFQLSPLPSRCSLGSSKRWEVGGGEWGC